MTKDKPQPTDAIAEEEDGYISTRSGSRSSSGDVSASRSDEQTQSTVEHSRQCASRANPYLPPACDCGAEPRRDAIEGLVERNQADICRKHAALSRPSEDQWHFTKLVLEDAADELTRLSGEVERLKYNNNIWAKEYTEAQSQLAACREALEPLVAWWDSLSKGWHSASETQEWLNSLKIGTMDKARTALATIKSFDRGGEPRPSDEIAERSEKKC